MATDPVCLVIVDEDSTPYKAAYRGTEYYFCTDYCRKQFEMNPKRYTRLSCDMNIEPGGSSC